MVDFYPSSPSNRPDLPEKTDTKVIDVEALIKKTIEEDAQAGMDMIFRHYYRLLCSHAVRYVSSRSVAEDIVSDILYEFHSKSIYLGVTTSYRAYLFTSVRNRAYDHVKRELSQGKTVIENASAIPVRDSEQPDSITQFEELHHLIEGTINSMPFKRKQVYMMHRFENKKSKEIAAELQLSQRTIESHIYKAIQQIHVTLREHWLWMVIFSVPLQLFFAIG